MSRLTKISLALIALGIFVFALSQLPAWFWHPLGVCVGATARDCKGYNSWSGIFSDLGELTLVVGLTTGSVAVRRFLHKHFECHEETCHKLGVHPVHGTPYRTCWHHHPVLSDHEKGTVPLAHIHAAHAQAHQEKL